MFSYRKTASFVTFLSLTLVVGCWDDDGSDDDDAGAEVATAQSCMSCHNGALHDDYNGPGMENPHPFPGAATLRCTQCHGGNPNEPTAELAHVPPPPEIGDEQFQIDNDHAYFNRLTLTGIDKFADYTVNGQTYSAIDYLQFLNPGDLRVVTTGRSCGACHMSHVDCVEKSMLATATGIFSGAMYAAGADNQVPANQSLYQDTAADLAFRAVVDPEYTNPAPDLGAVGELIEVPVYSVRGGTGDPLDIFNNQALYDATTLDNYIDPVTGRVQSLSPLANLYQEQIIFTCGDCHLGSAGANNRYGDFRSSGCTSCHMRYSLSGRYFGTDPNIQRDEPANVDQIDAPERAHVNRHMIVSTAQTLATGEVVQGMDDYTCAGCHQGSNRTVMQYWGIRLDQNQDVRNDFQYPDNPVSFVRTFNDTRLFDPVIDNNTFNGRNGNQYLLEEDYDGDGLDDTPPDVHYEAGLGCIDCHGSHDLHGGNVGDVGQPMLSRQDQAVSIRCESCHGTIYDYATTTTGLAYNGQLAQLAVDAEGNVIDHVIQEATGEYYLYSKLTGQRHYIRQTKDTVWDNAKTHPFTNQPLYSEKASYAMGRIDGDAQTGMGPLQNNAALNSTPNFTHSDNMSCASCHASWTNNCVGCHLIGEFDNNNFSNVTGDEIVYEEDEAQFTYQSPLFFQLGVDTHNKVSPISPNTLVFYQYQDQANQLSNTFTFSDRQGNGSSGTTPSLSHNFMMPHSIRGKVTSDYEGPRYCVACHLTDDAMANYNAAGEYETYRTAMINNDFSVMDAAMFTFLQEHIGRNPGNTLNSPYFINQVVGLGTGLFLFDENGCPVNTLDNNVERWKCDLDLDTNPETAPATIFDLARVEFNLDKIVEADGTPTGSNNHPMLDPNPVPLLRDGPSTDPTMAGPLGQSLIEKLSDPNTGLILDVWLNADGVPEGQFTGILTP